MRHASTTYSVPWTVLRAGAIDVIMSAHGVIENAKAQITTQRGLSPLCTYPYRLWIAGVYGRWSYHQTRFFCHNTRNGHRNDCKYLFYSYIRNGKLPTCQQKCQKGLWLDSKRQGYIEHQTSPGRLLYRNWESRENVYLDEHQFE